MDTRYIQECNTILYWLSCVYRSSFEIGEASFSCSFLRWAISTMLHVLKRFGNGRRVLFSSFVNNISSAKIKTCHSLPFVRKSFQVHQRSSRNYAMRNTNKKIKVEKTDIKSTSKGKEKTFLSLAAIGVPTGSLAGLCGKRKLRIYIYVICKHIIILLTTTSFFAAFCLYRKVHYVVLVVD